MSLSSVRLSLQIGKAVPSPAPAVLMTALESVEVNQSDDGDAGFSQGFQIVFRAQRSQAASADYALLNEPLLKPGNRVIVAVTLNATPRVLMDGIITHQEFAPATGPGNPARLIVTGKDLSVLMDMVEVSLGYPGLNHIAMVALALAKYAAFGIIPTVIPPPTSWSATPLEKIPFQEATDRTYLRQLAAEHGFIFGVKPGPAPLINIGYWGPVIKVGAPQKALTVDMGAESNVEAISFSNDALLPEQVYGLVHLRDTVLPVPVLGLLSTEIPLSRQPALIFNQPFVRKTRLAYQGDSPIEAYAEAFARTTRSAGAVVTATGRLDALRYQALLTAPGLVGVRGVGETYDGLYYVKDVKHQISLGQYQQAFTLVREGTGSLTQRV